MDKIQRRLEENLEYILERVGFGISFDVTVRRFHVAGRKAVLIFLDGFIKDTVTQEIMKSLLRIPRGGLGPNPTESLLRKYLPFFEIDYDSRMDNCIDQLVAGPMLLLIDGVRSCFIVDVREYPVRSVEEPDLERVTRGSREGFVETALFNITMVRRRVRDPNLRFEALKAGARSKTDVFMGYIEDVADPQLVLNVRESINGITRDALPMGGRSLEEYMFGTRFNPLPQTRYTERPDVVAAHLFEGHIGVFVDTTPFVLLVPVTAWHFTQHAEDYFQSPLVGTYLRWVRTLGVFVSVFFIAVWYSFVQMENIPQGLLFLGPKEEGVIPLWLQFLFLEVGLDLLRMALVHTPNALATSLGLVGAILLGELAVTVGLFAPEPILYIALVAIGSFGTPSLELAMALRLFRYVLFLGAVTMGWTGFFLATGLMVLIFARTKSFGTPYLWPVLPFDRKAFLRVLFRYPIPLVDTRPRITRPKNKKSAPRKKKKREGER